MREPLQINSLNNGTTKMNNNTVIDEIQTEIEKNRDNKYHLKHSKDLGLVTTTAAINYEELLSLPDLSKSTVNLIKRCYHLLKNELKKGMSVEEALRILKDKISKEINKAFRASKITFDFSKTDNDVKPNNPKINILSFILSKFFSQILKQQQLSIVK